LLWIPNWSPGLVPLKHRPGLKSSRIRRGPTAVIDEERTTMLFERPDVEKVLAMTGCLLGMTVIASIILNGARPPL
jgi:hypothetical protein